MTHVTMQMLARSYISILMSLRPLHKVVVLNHNLNHQIMSMLKKQLLRQNLSNLITMETLAIVPPEPN